MQLVKLTPVHRPAIARALSAQTKHCLLLLARLPRLGEDPEVAFWGLGTQGRLHAVLACDREDWALANPGGADLYPLAGVVKTGGDVRLRGEAGTVGAIARHLGPSVSSDRACLAVELSRSSIPTQDPRGYTERHPMRRLQNDEVEALVQRCPKIAAPVARAARNGGRAMALYDGEELVSAAWTEAEALGFAMIGGLYSEPARRRMGFGTSCLWVLCRELLQENLTPLLVYEDPIVGRLVGQLGFTPYGRWRQILLGQGSC
ncbi:MAG: GNAT family N-acetyltransferase [Bacteroidota bacterium]